MVPNMRFGFRLFIVATLLTTLACSGTSEPATPLQTFKTYIKAIKNKDTATMKLLLTRDSIKMHEQEAKAQGVSLDDIVKREPLFDPSQTSVEYRNEKVEGDRAKLEVKDPYGAWETVPFLKEDGVWKVDKKAYADQMENDIEKSNQQLDNLINQGKQP
jgi:hypothetical protein